ncbi:MAG TPA: hypothetical protein VMT21_05495 [Gemmatimonadales bacterium]|nr:hypothetical protein [Gemmatimonadales bacterium]
MRTSATPCLVLMLPLLAGPARAQPQVDSAPTVIPAAFKQPLWRRPWVRPVASLILPGAGQLLGGRDRGMVYVAAEVWFVARAIALSAQGRRQRDAFIDLGYDVARAPFTPDRLDAPWEYYEAMSHWVESGAYNLGGPGGALRPETDTLTYNGAMWLLARRNYLTNPDSIPPSTDPAYQAALAFYRQRAFGDAYRWSWKNARLEMDTYAETIRESDNDFRYATTYLGAIVLNHLASAVDAFITLRVAGGSILPRARVSGSRPGYYLMWNWEF